MAKILFVDDDKTMRNAISIILKKHDISITDSREEALKILDTEHIELLLTDLHLPEKDTGLDLVKEARERHEDLYIAVLTGFASIETAIEAIKTGADDYMAKEFTPDSLRLSVEKFINEGQNKRKLRKLEAENLILRNKKHGSMPLIGTSAVMQEIKHKIGVIGQDNDSTVLILGKSGTGKELAAAEIHRQSTRCHFSFIPIDCPTIPKDLFESELFGYEKGAFTDARSRKLGRIELADRGTLFLDEIGDLPLPMQAKLLRFLETGEFYRIGSTRPVQVDVRVIASTNRNLEQLVQDRLFREDLFYRLGVVVISMPELKEREGDVILLARHFLSRINTRKGRKMEFDDDSIRKLRSHHWPGNVRELKNIVESFSVLGEIPLIITRPRKDIGNYKDARQQAITAFEKEYLTKALGENQNNITRTAKNIGISREELSRKIKKLKENCGI